jgi:hypothetical protein
LFDFSENIQILYGLKAVVLVQGGGREFISPQVA